MTEKVKGITSFSSDTSLAFVSSLSASVLRQVYIESNTVHQCVNQIATNIADLPYEVLVKPPLNQDQIKKKLFQQVGPTGETFRDTLTALVIDLLVTNKGVMVPIFTLEGRLKGFTCRDAMTFSPKYLPNGILAGYVQQVNGKVFNFAPDEIVYIEGIPKSYTKQGLSIIESITYEISNLISNLLSVNRKERKPVGVFVLQEEVGADVIDRLQQDLTALINGEANKVPIVWGAGKGEWIDIIKQFDVQLLTAFLDRMDWLVRTAFGFSPPGSSLLSPSGKPLQFSTLLPHITRAIQTKLNNFLRSYGIEIEFKIPPVQTITDLVVALKSGLISPNEARQFLLLPPIAGGNQLNILQPKGLTPVGKAPSTPTPQQETTQSLTRAVDSHKHEHVHAINPNEVTRLRNLRLLDDPIAADFVLNRYKLAERMNTKMKKIYDELTKFLNDTYMLMKRGYNPKTDNLDTWYIQQITQTLNQFEEPAIQLGFSWANHYWKKYDQALVQQYIEQETQKIRAYLLQIWKRRYNETKKDAENRNWDEVKNDLESLKKSFLVAGAFVALTSHLPLRAITSYFERQGRVILFKWVGIGDQYMCDDCDQMHGNTYTAAELEIIGRWPGSGSPFGAQGIRCDGRCRCILVPVTQKDQEYAKEWLKKKLSLQGLHIPESELFTLNILDHVDKDLQKALLKEPRLREPMYYTIFDKITYTSEKTAFYNPETNTLYIPRTATQAEARKAFADAIVRCLLTRYDYLDPTQPLFMQVNAIMKKVREDLWESGLDVVLPKKYKEVWLTGEGPTEVIKELKHMSLPLDLPYEAYFDESEFFRYMFSASIFAPRSDLPGMDAFTDLLASTLWAPETYKKWIGRTLKAAGRPWNARLSVEQTLKQVPSIDPSIESFLASILERYPTLRVPRLWQGLDQIVFDPNTSSYNATYSVEVPYEDFVRSFSATIFTTKDDFQFLHELGHHIYTRHVVYNSALNGIFSSLYFYKILFPLYEAAAPFMNQKELKKFTTYMLTLKDAEEKGELVGVLDVTQENFEKDIFAPLEDRAHLIGRNWTLPLRFYTLRNPNEAFAELFAMFTSKPTLLYYTDSEFYDYFLTIMKSVAVNPYTMVKEGVEWEKVARALKKVGFTDKEIRGYIAYALTNVEDFETVNKISDLILAAAKKDAPVELKEAVQQYIKEIKERIENPMTRRKALKMLKEESEAEKIRKEKRAGKQLLKFLKQMEELHQLPKGEDYKIDVMKTLESMNWLTEDQRSDIYDTIINYLDNKKWHINDMAEIRRRLKRVRQGGRARKAAFKWFKENLNIEWPEVFPKGDAFKKDIRKMLKGEFNIPKAQKKEIYNKILKYLENNQWDVGDMAKVWHNLKKIPIEGKERESAIKWFEDELNIKWPPPIPEKPEEFKDCLWQLLSWVPKSKREKLFNALISHLKNANWAPSEMRHVWEEVKNARLQAITSGQKAKLSELIKLK